MSFPAETWSEIGGWLANYHDFSNLAVALGVKWNPATQAQRMICKYRDDFLRHVPIGDQLTGEEHFPTRNKRLYINFSTQQMDFYRFLIRRMPKVVERSLLRCLEETSRDPDTVGEWEEIEAFLRLGTRVDVALFVSPQWIEHIMSYEPAVVELLVENGILGDHNMALDTYFQSCFHVPDHCSWVGRLIRWGLPVDLDSVLRMTVEYTTIEYEPLEEDRIYNKFDPQTQFQAQTFIQQLLEFGADPMVLVDTKTQSSLKSCCNTGQTQVPSAGLPARDGSGAAKRTGSCRGVST
ncbi:hypothetical protein HK102_010227, partial [Quaeritorhiza haematococci]